MTMNWIKQNKKLVVALLVILVSPAVGWALYRILGPTGTQVDDASETSGIFTEILEQQNIYGLRFLLASLPLFLAILVISLRPRIITQWPSGSRFLERHTDAVDALSDAHMGFWIALAAGLGLYIELMIIRIHSSYFQLFAYFKNVSLLSCFLGLGIGYARGSRRPLATPMILPLLGLQIIAMYVLRYSLGAKVLQNPISEQLTLGMRQAKEIGSIAMAYGFVVLIFTFNALCFIPLGHLASRLMMRRPKLVSYGWNLAGSLGGILVFSLISFLWTPPAVWIILAAVGVMAFLPRHVPGLLPSAAVLVLLLVILSAPVGVSRLEVYSPYQVLALTMSKERPPVLKTSNTYYQRILDLREESIRDDLHLQRWAEYYMLPYLFKPNPADVLIVGSGTGNDVAAALRGGAGLIDAVEIDPVILRFGGDLHPEAPYQADNVTAIVDDARAFIEHTDKKYDLIVYGLLDSHTLLSGRTGGIRLDSYVYTVEAFRAAREKLKDRGIISLTFSLLGRSLGRKLYLMLQDAFDGQRPVIYRAGYDSGYTFLAGDGVHELIPPTTGRFKEVTAWFAESDGHVDKSTDDWPFFYMPERKYPISYVAMIVMLLVVSLALVREFVPTSGGGFSIPCFFLGAGFMLVETKGITELALVYGSTWIVISVVITAILIMAFLANLLVIRLGNPSRTMTYGLLLASLVAGLGLTYANVGSLAPWLSRPIMTIALTIPLFFSGFAFSDELRRSPSVAVALSSNLLGAMLGGFVEYNSMYFGFRSLYFFAFIMYGLALLGTFRKAKAGAQLLP